LVEYLRILNLDKVWILSSLLIEYHGIPLPLANKALILYLPLTFLVNHKVVIPLWILVPDKLWVAILACERELVEAAKTPVLPDELLVGMIV
jgi:hypothetical protein